MTLRRRTLLIVMVTLAALLVILYAVADVAFMGSMLDLEEQDTLKNVGKVQNILGDELADLDATTWDWAAWDDTYAFVEDGNEEYIKSNLVNGTFTTLRLNLMLFLNASDQIVCGKAVELANETAVPIPEGVYEHLQPDSPLLQHEDMESSITGVILLPDGPMLVAARPILTSKDEGPIRGTLIMGRYLDSVELEYLSEVSHLPLTLQLLTDEPLDPELQAVRPSLSADSPIAVQPLNEQTMRGYILVNDVYGNPALVVSAELPRSIYEEGKAAMSYFILIILAVGLVFIILILVLLEFLVLSPVSQLSTSVQGITARGDLSARVPMTGKDEVLTLANNINSMLVSLESSQQALRSSEENYRVKSRELEQFTYTVSHDLRSPLITIQGFAEMLLRDLETNNRETAKADLQYITNATEKMDRLLMDTLELSRIGRIVNTPENVPFGAIVQDALAQTAGAIRAHQIEVSVAEDFPTVHVDRLRIEELLVNLIANSIKYRGENPQPKIEIGYRRGREGEGEDEDTVFFVRDNGIGIDKSEQEKVFDLFYQGDKKSGGTGAGLAIVKRIIEVHGGRIWIESEKDNGTTVCFTLPVR
jgi:sensor domain CHASE-containing protein/nitrogen-specific signal transduction histidine kinase